MDDIKLLLNSSDLDNVYMATLMIRNSTFLDKSLLNTISLFDKVRNYSDVCYYLNVKELTIESFNFLSEEEAIKQLAFHQIKNIEKLFNDGWTVSIEDNNQYKYFPYFTLLSCGLVFSDSGHGSSFWAGSVGVYKDSKTSDFIGKTFIDIYKNII